MFKEPVNIPLESLHKLLRYDFGKFYNQGKKGLRGLSDTHMPGGTVVKNLPAKQETWVRSLGGEDPLEKEMVTHSSILAWRTPRTGQTDGLWSTGLQRVGHD